MYKREGNCLQLEQLTDPVSFGVWSFFLAESQNFNSPKNPSSLDYSKTTLPHPLLSQVSFGGSHFWYRGNQVILSPPATYVQCILHI